MHTRLCLSLAPCIGTVQHSLSATCSWNNVVSYLVIALAHNGSHFACVQAKWRTRYQCLQDPWSWMATTTRWWTARTRPSLVKMRTTSLWVRPCCPAVVQFFFGSCSIVVQLFFNCCLTVVRLLSGCCPVVARLLLGCFSAFARLSFGQPNASGVAWHGSRAHLGSMANGGPITVRLFRQAPVQRHQIPANPWAEQGGADGHLWASEPARRRDTQEDPGAAEWEVSARAIRLVHATTEQACNGLFRKNCKKFKNYKKKVAKKN